MPDTLISLLLQTAIEEGSVSLNGLPEDVIKEIQKKQAGKVVKMRKQKKLPD